MAFVFQQMRVKTRIYLGFGLLIAIATGVAMFGDQPPVGRPGAGRRHEQHVRKRHADVEHRRATGSLTPEHVAL